MPGALLIQRRVTRARRYKADPPVSQLHLRRQYGPPQVPDYFFLEDGKGGLELHYIYFHKGSGEYLKLRLVPKTLHPFGEPRPLTEYDRRVLRV